MPLTAPSRLRAGTLRYDQRVTMMDREAVNPAGTKSKQHHLWSYKCPVGSADASIEDQEFFHRLVARSDFTPEFHRIPHCLPASRQETEGHGGEEQV